jgi:hypothetical protein
MFRLAFFLVFLAVVFLIFPVVNLNSNERKEERKKKTKPITKRLLLFSPTANLLMETHCDNGFVVC